MFSTHLKTKKMAPRLIIAILIIFGFGCNTMNSKSQKISSDNKDQKFEYSPKDYELNKIDITINDSVRLIVKHYTLMDSYVAPYGPVTSDSITYGYRDYAMEIELLKQGTVIINKKLLKSDFSLDKNYIKKCVFNKVWLESVDYKRNKFKLQAGIGVPDSDNSVIADLTLGIDGKIDIKTN